MFLIVRAVSSLTSRARTFSNMSNQCSDVSFGVLMKSEVSIFPPGTHHLPGKAFSLGERLQIKYLPSEFLMIPVTAIWWVLLDMEKLNISHLINCWFLVECCALNPRLWIKVNNQKINKKVCFRF